MRKPVKRGSAEYGYILTQPEGVAGLFVAYVYVERDKVRDMLVGEALQSKRRHALCHRCATLCTMHVEEPGASRRVPLI